MLSIIRISRNAEYALRLAKHYASVSFSCHCTISTIMQIFDFCEIIFASLILRYYALITFDQCIGDQRYRGIAWTLIIGEVIYANSFFLYQWHYWCKRGSIQSSWGLALIVLIINKFILSARDALIFNDAGAEERMKILVPFYQFCRALPMAVLNFQSDIASDVEMSCLLLVPDFKFIFSCCEVLKIWL